MNRSTLSGSTSWVLILIYLVIILAPMGWFFTISVKRHVDAIAYPPVFRFEPIGSNYKELLRESQFSRALANSAIVGAGSVALSAIIGIPAAHALSHRKIRRQRGILMGVLTLRTMPRIVFIVPFFIVLKTLGLTDTRIGLIITYQTFTLPFFVWTIQPFFEDVSPSLEESARMDGATPMQRLLRVVLPVVAPGVATTCILSFILSWNEFLWALIFTRGKALTAPVAIMNFMAYEGIAWGKVAAGATLVLIPAVVFSIISRRYTERSISQGAVKE